MWTLLRNFEAPERGEVLRVKVGPQALAVVNSEGQLYALNDQCPHAGALLSEGSIEGRYLVCAWHGRAYDLVTGRCEGYQGVQAFPVAQHDDGVYVRLGEQTPPPEA